MLPQGSASSPLGEMGMLLEALSKGSDDKSDLDMIEESKTANSENANNNDPSSSATMLSPPATEQQAATQQEQASSSSAAVSMSVAEKANAGGLNFLRMVFALLTEPDDTREDDVPMEVKSILINM